MICIKYVAGFLVSILLIPALVMAAEMKINFENETPGADAKSFSKVVGNWHIDKDDGKTVYAVDGRKKGTVFPLSEFKEVKDFKNGTIEVSFKAISGKEDQAGGIAFNIKSDGDYLIVRANALEDNLVLFKMVKGRRSAVKEISDVPTPTLKWHGLKVTIKGKKIEGWLDGKKYLDYDYKENISGKVGLWSKADSYVFFDNFTVKP